MLQNFLQKYLEEKIFKIKIIKNVSVTVRTCLTLICIKWVTGRPKHYIFGDDFCSKNARRLRFYVFLHFNARKHVMLSLYDVITSNLVWVPGDPQLEQSSQFLVNLVHFRLMSCSLTWNRRNIRIWASCHLSSKISFQKHTAWVPGTKHRSVFAISCLFLKKSTKFLNQIVALKCFSS